MMLRRILMVVVIGCLLSLSAYAAAAERIVSLAPSITEILYDLGLEKNIAAVTNYCNYPARAKTKPKIGGYANPSIEAIVAKRPDLVIMTREANPGHIKERLDKLGIRTYIFKARRLSELPGAMRELGKTLGVANKAERKARAMEKTIAKFSNDAKMKKKKPGLTRAMFVVQPESLIVAGPGTVIDEALNILGLQNIAEKAVMPYPKYSVEEIIRLNPEVIFVGTGHHVTSISQGLLKKLKMLNAVKNKRIYLVSESLYRLGPRTVDGMGEIAHHLQSR